MKQRRDENGRFAKNHPDWKLLTVLFIFVSMVSLSGLIPIWMEGARAVGYSDGYSEGSNDASLPAFERGREFERNWTDCEYMYRNWYGIDGHWICRKDQTGAALVDANYNIVYEFTNLIPDNATITGAHVDEC